MLAKSAGGQLQYGGLAGARPAGHRHQSGIVEGQAAATGNGTDP